MNERIRELADEADKWSQIMTWSHDPKYGDRPVSDLFNEKFAELIVRECVKVIDDMADPESSDGYFWTIVNVSDKVKQRFGVAE